VPESQQSRAFRRHQLLAARSLGGILVFCFQAMVSIHTSQIQVVVVRMCCPPGTGREKKAEVEVMRLEKLHDSGELDLQAALKEARTEPLEVGRLESRLCSRS